MAEVISLSTFHNHNLTDQDHALFMQTVTSQSGLFYGCEVTLKDENTLHVSTGEGIACGRIFRIMDMDYPVELSASGDLLGRLYVHIDTALDDTPAQLMDVQGSTLPALIQEDDMNQSTGVYEIELATFSINELGISNLEFTAPKATGGGAGGKSIAPDYSATESYEKGRIFFQNGTLYKTIAAIPAGAPLVVDTNVVETSLAAEIEALNQNLTSRWNPTTKYYEVYDNGQWYQDRYFNPHWDGYIFNRGAYNPEYIGEWTQSASVGGGSSARASIVYQNNPTFTLNSYMVGWISSGSFARTTALPQNANYDKLRIHLGSWSESHPNQSYNRTCSYTLRIKNASNSVLSQVTLYTPPSSGNASTGITIDRDVDIDISSYKQQEIYMDITYSYGHDGGAGQEIRMSLFIDSIQML